jgi:signal transduction histidine kinase/ligand-binding sensor domain-containing protein
MNNILKICFKLLAVLSVLVLPAEIRAKNIYRPKTGDPIAELWRCHSYPELKGKGLSRISEGKDETIWFNGEKGIFRYDGLNWTFYNSENSVLCVNNLDDLTPVSLTEDGTVYVGDACGVCKFQEGKWERIFPKKGSWKTHWLIQASDKSLWVGLDIGVLRIKDGIYTLYTSEMIKKRLENRKSSFQIKVIPKLPIENIENFFEIRIFEVGDDLWVSARLEPERGAFLLRWKNFHHTKPESRSSWKLFTEEDGVEIAYNMIILKASDGTIWLSSAQQQKGIYHYNLSTDKFFRVNLDKFGLTYKTHSLIESKDSTIWIGDWGKFLRYKKGKGKVYTSEELPIPEATIIVSMTMTGDIWFHGRYKTAYRIDCTDKHWLTYEGLNFQCETDDGKKWFLTPEGYAVSEKENKWFQYSKADGLIETPVVLKVGKDGRLWAAGSHKDAAATAYFENDRWVKQLHPNLSWGVGYLAVCDLMDSSMLFGSGTEFSGYDGGMKHFEIMDRGEKWSHYKRPVLIQEEAYAIEQTSDGTIWIGGQDLSRFDGKRARVVTDPEELSSSWISYLYSTPEGNLWVSKHGSGLFHFDGQRWNHYTVEDGLASNTISSIISWNNNTILAATPDGISAFDGKSWTRNVFLEHFLIPLEAGMLKKDSEGSLWINLSSREWYFRGLSGKRFNKESFSGFKTVRYRRDILPPETEITFGLKEVGTEGNTNISWKGKDAWNTTPPLELAFSYRLNNNEWSAFSRDNTKQFLGLANGNYRFEVRARDTDFNIDPTPAVLNFTVMAPFWKQHWFIILIGGLTGLIVFQTMRVIKRDKQLIESNEQLKEKTIQIEKSRKELESFAYSVSHDLRAPLRAIDGFSLALLEDCGKKLNKEETHFLERIRAGSQQMGQLIDDLLSLSRTTRKKMTWEIVNLSGLAKEVARDLKERFPDRKVKFIICKGETVRGDPHLLRIVINNLMENALKFTKECKKAKIEFGVEEKDDKKVYYVKDNGVGFDMDYVKKLFNPFQRLHSSESFSGTGVGLANVRSVIERHSGEVWAESEGEGKGATFYFTLWVK